MTTLPNKDNNTNPAPPSLSSFPDELLLHILTYLDLPDLLSLSRTSHTLRTLSLDPILHASRLHRASNTLSHSLPLRPSLGELMAQRIYITRTTLAARRLGRSLVMIKLNKKLRGRPSVESLVEWGVLPEECFRKEGRVSPALVEKKRMVERERVRDFLRSWVEVWRVRGERVKGEEGGEKPDVRVLVRRFARGSLQQEGREQQSRWGAQARMGGNVKEEPTRAKVLGLRRFWEKVGREGMGN
jgi:hypothetical protein